MLMRRLGFSMLLAGVGLAVGLTDSMLWAQGGRGCWGSICQDQSGAVFVNGPLSPTQLISIATTPGAIEMPGDLTIVIDPVPGGSC